MIDTWTSFRELYAATRRAARGKRRRASVARTLFYLEPTVLELQRRLRAGTWTPGASTNHVIHDGKTRTITVAPFVDRIVHQALCSAIGPLLDRSLIHHTYACRVGLGTHAALRTATAWARTYPWFAHLDVVKFFPTIDHALLLAQLARDIPCPATLEICRLIVVHGSRSIVPVRFHFPGDDLFTPLSRSVGLPIGNLTSQHFANRFLSPIDHRATDRRKIHAYLRYMDDVVLFGTSKAEVEDHTLALQDAFDRQRMRLHPWRVRRTREGVNFVGFRILPEEIRVRRTTVVRALRRLTALSTVHRGSPEQTEALLRSLRATLAHWEHADSYRLRTQLLTKMELLYDSSKPDEDEE